MDTDCADDGGSSVVFGRFILGIQLSEPFNPRPSRVDMVKGVGHAEAMWCM